MPTNNYLHQRQDVGRVINPVFYLLTYQISQNIENATGIFLLTASRGKLQWGFQWHLTISTILWYTVIKFFKRGAEMVSHTFTTEQVQKFIGAVGGDVPKSEIIGGEFTTQQLITLAEQVGGFKDWPKATDDPRVNFAVDCVVQYDEEDLIDFIYDEKVYIAEADAFKKSSCGRKWLKNFKKQFA